MKLDIDDVEVYIRECKDVVIKCPKCGARNMFYDVNCGETLSEECRGCGQTLEYCVSDF